MLLGLVMKIFLIVLFSFSTLFATMGSSEMGRTIYQSFFRDELGYIGDDFTAKYTIDEWEEIFKDEGKEFKLIFGVTPNLKAFFQREDFDTFLPHIKAFAIEYAKDSGYVPNCIEFTSRGQNWED